MNTNDILAQEREEHNELYSAQADRLSQYAMRWSEYYQLMCVPPHKGGSMYGLDHRLFFDRLYQHLQEQDRPLRILDYGCGTGGLGIALASLGHEVYGFDLSDDGIRIAKENAARMELSEQTHFVVANAQQLPYGADQFDLIVGKAVLHHVIKYPGTEKELKRVMKPRSKAYFLEGAAGNPLIALARRFTIQEELGDVPLTPAKVRRYGADFTEVQLEGYFFMYMLKRFGYNSSDETLPQQGRNKLGQTTLFKGLLRLALGIDELLVNRKILSLAGRYLIEFEK